MYDGVDFHCKPESGGIKVAEKPIAEGSFALDNILDFPGFNLLACDRLEQAQIVNLVLRNLASLQNFRPPEKITLKIRESRFLASVEFFLGFNFFGQHVATRAPEELD